MWIRMDADKLNEYLDDQIKNYEKNNKYLAKTNSFIMIPISMFWGLIIAFFIHIIFNSNTLGILEYFIITSGSYIIWECIMIAPMIKEYYHLKSMSGVEKRKYLLEKMEKRTKRFCPDCSIFYKSYVSAQFSA